MVVFGGESRLVRVNVSCAIDGSCCPSLSTASAWTLNGPPFCGAGNVEVQFVDGPPGLESVAGFCAITFSHDAVAAFHHSCAFTSCTVTKTWSTLVLSVAVPVMTWLPLGLVTVALAAGDVIVVCGGPLSAPPKPKA